MSTPCTHLRVIWWRTPPYRHRPVPSLGLPAEPLRFTEGFDCADCDAHDLTDSPLTIADRGGTVVAKIER